MVVVVFVVAVLLRHGGWSDDAGARHGLGPCDARQCLLPVTGRADSVHGVHCPLDWHRAVLCSRLGGYGRSGLCLRRASRRQQVSDAGAHQESCCPHAVALGSALCLQWYNRRSSTVTLSAHSCARLSTLSAVVLQALIKSHVVRTLLR